MITRQYGQIAFECDNCDEVLETEEDDFAAAIALFHRSNWKAQKIGAEWVHSCPRCRGDGGFQYDN